LLAAVSCFFIIAFRHNFYALTSPCFNDCFGCLRKIKYQLGHKSFTEQPYKNRDYYLKWHIPISFFFVCGKRAGMPINKGLNAPLRVWKTFEVRYQVPKKFGFRGVRVVSLHQPFKGCATVWINCMSA